MAKPTPDTATVSDPPTPPRTTMSIIELAIRLVAAIGCDKDAPTPHDYGVLVSNLCMLRTNCPPALWGEELWDYLAMPDDVHPEKFAFLNNTIHYGYLANKLDELYEKHC